jgi:predicted TIM-barrel fold metal-dependent hydrolase
MAEYISADNHLNTKWLPKDLWLERLPPALRDVGPLVEETAEGSFWFWEGQRRCEAADGSSHARLAAQQFRRGKVEVAPGELPPAQPELALRHLESADIRAAVFFGDSRLWKVEDRELRLAVVRAYNDFVGELTSQSPDRLLYLPKLPVRDPEECVAELRRLEGARAVEFMVMDLGAPISDSVWDPLFAEAAARGVVLCSHIGNSSQMVRPEKPRDGQVWVYYSTSPFSAAMPLAQMVFSGVFERHPSLQWMMAESRIGWLPFFFNWMDRQVEIRQPDETVTLSRPPSEYIRRNVRFTFEDDRVGIGLLEAGSVLADVVLWGADWPHVQFVWPDPTPVLDELFQGIDSDIRRIVTRDRGAALFGFPDK